MTFRTPRLAPRSRIAESQQGRVMGRFCLTCGGVYPQYAGRHSGKPMYGKDHVTAPCSHEGERFTSGELWWEPAVEVLASPPTEPE